MPPVCQENVYNAPEFLQCHRHLQHNTTMERPEIALVAQQEFMSFEDFKHAMDEWAIVNGFTFFYYQKSDTGRRIVKCRLQN